MASPNVQVTDHPIGGGGSPSYLGAPGGAVGFYTDPFGATFIGQINGTVLTVFAPVSGTISLGQSVNGAGITAGTTITSLGTGLGGQGANAAGTYNVSLSQVVAAQSMTSVGGAVPQRSNTQQVPVSQAASAGVAISLQTVSTLTPTAIPAITVSSLPISALAISFLTTDALIVSKPSGQTIGVVNARAQATPANVVLFDYANVSQASVTPAPNEIYSMAVVRNVAQAVGLTPQSVPASSCAEQQFNVTGVAVGMLTNVQKPSSTPSIGIVGSRVVSNNLLGVTFLNTSTGAITPPAETYLVTALNGLNAQNNAVIYGVNVGAAGPVIGNTTSAFVITEQTFTVSGIGAQDIAMGPPQKPTLQGQIAAMSARITTANAIAFGFGTGSVSGISPTASEIYATSVYKSAPPALLTLSSVTLTPVAVGPGQAAEQAFTVTPLAAFSPVLVNRPSATSGLGIGNVRVSAAGVLAITYMNPTTGTILPPAETYIVGQFMPAPNQGAYVQMAVVPSLNATVNMANELRNALAPVVGVGLIAGG